MFMSKKGIILPTAFLIHTVDCIGFPDKKKVNQISSDLSALIFNNHTVSEEM